MEGEVIIVVVDATKEITDYAMEWAVCNVIKAMDTLILLAVLPSSRGPPPAAGNNGHQFFSGLLRKWGLVHNKAENSSSLGHIGINKAVGQDMLQRINNVCAHMLQQLLSANNVTEVHTEVKVVADAEFGSVAAQARELEASWVILDRRLKKEGDWCLKQYLNCNVVLIDHAIPKILRSVNPMTLKKLYMSGDKRSDPAVADMLGVMLPPAAAAKASADHTPTANTRSSLSSDSTPSLFSDCSLSLKSSDREQYHKSSDPVISDHPTKSEARNSFLNLNSLYFHQEEEVHDDQTKFSISASYSKSQPLISKTSSFYADDSPGKSPPNFLGRKDKSHGGLLKMKNDLKNFDSIKKSNNPARQPTDSRHLWRQPENLQNDSHQFITRRHSLSSHKSEAPARPATPSPSTIERTSSIRRAMSISIKHPPMPSPLCSICKHNAPIFGKTPRKFGYKEIERATDGFSSKNFLAEGGYGAIYKGVLPDGQVVAVKQHKMLSAQGAAEFVCEVEVLSCAQHRNLVMLVGYCTETEWLLIYEFACNGSLDKRLYGRETSEVMSWNNRMKVAKGAARGLRYLHEDCRVGCIVHRDFRPNNILLTHDFKAMVGDFGLARWQTDGQLAEETRVIGAFGYLAPEYTQTGLITEKADVYAFGVVLLELLSGIKATDFSRNTGKQFVMDWGSPLLEKKMINEIIDPRLEHNYVEKEVEYMMYAANLCTSPEPERRPTMSKVLKILEGDIATDMAYDYPGQKLTPNYPKRYIKNIYGAETPMLQTPKSGNSRELKPLEKLSMSLSPSRLSTHGSKDLNVTFKPLAPAKEHKLVSSEWGLNQSDVHVNEEYQAYLQGSLAKFIENFNRK